MYLYMSGLEVNKILASIILAVLIVTLIGHFGDLVIDIDHDEKKETAYKIDVPEDAAGVGVVEKKEEVIEPISILLASASLDMEKNYSRNVQHAIIMRRVAPIK